MIRAVGATKRVRGLSNIFCSSENINSQNCININSTGVSYYDDFLDSSLTNYFEKKNLEGHIEYMTPMEYYEGCAKVFNTSVSNLQQQRKADDDSISYLSNRLQSGQKFYLPYINYANEGQEGLHRMMVLANLFGWNDVRFPVLVVDYIDARKAKSDAVKQQLHKAIQESLQYKYIEDSLPDQLTEQIKWELDRIDESTNYDPVVVNQSSSSYSYSVEGYESDFKIEVSLNEIQFRDLSDFEIDDDDLDIGLDDLDDESILRRFGI